MIIPNSWDWKTFLDQSNDQELAQKEQQMVGELQGFQEPTWGCCHGFAIYCVYIPCKSKTNNIKLFPGIVDSKSLLK